MNPTLNPYRFISSLQALAYLWLASSLFFYPPKPAPSELGRPQQVTVFTTVVSAEIVVIAAVVLAVFMLGTAAWWPKWTNIAHTLFIPVLVFYGTANFSTSLQNQTGYQVAALCLVAACGHAIALVLRKRAVIT